MVYKIVIPCRMPNLNDFLDAHHIGFKWKPKGKAMIVLSSKGSQMKKDWQKKCELHIRNALLGRKLNTPVNIHYHYFEIDKKRDKGNIHGFCEKVFEDALQSAGAITNDGWNQIEEITTEFDVDEKRPRVEITIVEVEDGKCYSRGTEIQFQ